MNINKQKIAIDYIALHKDNNIELWQPYGLIGDRKLEEIYSNLVGGVYGEITEEDGEFRVVIDRFDSLSGNPVDFFWSDSK